MIPAAFRDGHQPLVERLLNGSIDLTFADGTKLLAMSVVELILAIMTTSVCRRIRDFEGATTTLLREYARQFAPASARE